MDILAIMAILGLISTVVTAGASLYQQDREFNQQENLLSNEQEFQREREDLAFQRSLPSTIYQDFLNEGFNPNIAANAVMGNGGISADSNGSPSAPVTNSAIQALQSALGKGGSDLQDSFLKAAEIQNLNANSNKTEVEAGLLPRDFQLRRMSTAAQINAWESSAKLACKQAGYTEEMTRLVENQNLYYGRLSEAQIQAYQGQVVQAYASAINQLEQAKTESNKRSNIDANTAVQIATEQNVRENTNLTITEQSTEFYRSERERIAKEFEQKLNGIPLTADAQKMVQKMVADGDVEGIQNFYLTIFATAQNQALGEYEGQPQMKFSVPYIWDYKVRTGSQSHYFGPTNRSYWNPPFIMPSN